MRKLLLAGACALALGGCSNLGQTLNIVGTDLGIVAADLPTACGNGSAVISAAVQSGVVPSGSKAASNLNKLNNAINQYCGPTSQALAATQGAINAIQLAIAAFQAAQASGQ